jgi:leader peptidase (prepilin peptidase)/N-methyltransferase
MYGFPLALIIWAGVLAFVLGTVFGSFIDCLAWRIVHHESVLKGRSHCGACGHVLNAADLVPVLSFLFLKGRCRYCHAKIPADSIGTEILLGAAYIGAFLRYGFRIETVTCMVLATILLGLSLVDLETMVIPDGFLIAMVIWWLPYVLLSGDPKTRALGGLAGGLIIGGGVLVIDLIFERIRKVEGMGGGDIKLLFVIGLYLGPWIGLFHLILSCMLGLLMTVILGKKKIPFGPALSLSAYVCLLFGSAFLTWYTGLLGI